MSSDIRGLTVSAAMGAGICGGVFFAFSTFVMRALGRLPDSQGIAAMQSINREAPSPLFMAAFIGTAVLSVGAIVVAIRRTDEPYAVYMMIGGALYLVGFVLTAAYHIPRNDALDLVDPTSPNAVHAWAVFQRNWTRWNHVRTLSSVGGALAFTMALFAD